MFSLVCSMPFFYFIISKQHNYPYLCYFVFIIQLENFSVEYVIILVDQYNLILQSDLYKLYRIVLSLEAMKRHSNRIIHNKLRFIHVI